MLKTVKVKSIKKDSVKIYEFSEEKAKALVKGGTHKIVKSGTPINSVSKDLEKKEATDMTNAPNVNSDEGKEKKDSEPKSIMGGRVVKFKIVLNKLIQNGKSYKLPVLLRRNKDHKSK